MASLREGALVCWPLAAQLVESMVGRPPNAAYAAGLLRSLEATWLALVWAMALLYPSCKRLAMAAPSSQSRRITLRYGFVAG